MLIDRFRVSERKACAVVGLSRSVWRHAVEPLEHDSVFRNEVLTLAATYGRYGYRMIAGLMRNAGWNASAEKVKRIWRQEGLKVPEKQAPRGRLWFHDGSCIRLKPEHKNHVWSYDFVQIKDARGGKIRLLTLIDEYSRQCLGIYCARKIGANQVD